MTVIKINAITVPEDSGDELARRFAARAGAVDDQDGFEGFELLRPTDERHTWLVLTRWRDEEAFQAWTSSPAFAHGHRGSGSAEGPGETAAGHPAEHPAERGAGHGHGHGTEEAAAGHSGGQPVGLHSELWSFEVAGGSRPA